MIETNYSNGGFRRITRLTPPVRMRVFGFGLLMITGTILLTWITRATWDQLARLRNEHAAVRTESFYLGVTLRGSVRALNEQLLQFGRTEDPTIQEDFNESAMGLKSWFQTNRVKLTALVNLQLLKHVNLERHLEMLRRAETAYDAYLKHAQLLLTHTPQRSFEEDYRLVRGGARELLAVCDQLVAAQAQGFGQFLGETQSTLARHQRLLQLSSVLILAMAGALAIMVYRGMIAPLRLRLTQTHTIMQRQEKLASLGVLASGVAHEIRNPLTAIKIRLFSLNKSLPQLTTHEDAVVIGNEINRLERIVRDFLQFARPSEPVLEMVPAERILREVQDLMKGTLDRSSVRLHVQVKDTTSLYADPEQVKQVLINLVQNSAENMPGDGDVVLGLRRGVEPLNGATQPAAIISVEDTGNGIASEVEERLFDPFFTTKEGGTGLGLSIAARIVEKHGGVLRYRTEVNRGTTFEVVLPEYGNEQTENSAHRR